MDPIVIFPPPGCQSSCYQCHTSVPGQCGDQVRKTQHKLMSGTIKMNGPVPSVEASGLVIGGALVLALAYRQIRRIF